MAIPKTFHRLQYDSARREIQDGAIALSRGWAISSEYADDPSLLNKWIATKNRIYCHAGMIMRTHNHCLLLDTIQWRGGGVSQMSEQVREFPGLWDIYHVTHVDFSKRLAVKRMCEIIGKRYGWWALIVASLRHTAIGRYWFPHIAIDSVKKYSPYCSMAVSDAIRRGRVDLCPNRADLFTEPVHIAQSEFTEYLGTLVI